MDYQREYIDKNPNMHLHDAKNKAAQIDNIIPSNIMVSSMLDIACGAGLVTIEMTKMIRPKYVVGIDISRKMIRKAGELDKNKIINWKAVDIFKYRHKTKFDLVTCIDIIEHINDDFGFLKKAAGMGKYIVIRTPLEDSLFSKMLRRKKIFDTWKDTEKRYGHIHHYDEKKLLKLIRRSELVVIKETSVPMPRRSKLIWEIFRILFYPISIISMEMMVRISGGFKIYLLSKRERA